MQRSAIRKDTRLAERADSGSRERFAGRSLSTGPTLPPRPIPVGTIALGTPDRLKRFALQPDVPATQAAAYQRQKINGEGFHHVIKVTLVMVIGQAKKWGARGPRANRPRGERVDGFIMPLESAGYNDFASPRNIRATKGLDSAT